MTHIDLLSPQMEWAPPYDWRTGTRPKEVQIAAATDAAREQFGQRVTSVVPVCAAEGRVFNVEGELLPALLKQLDEANGVALLRVLHAEADADKARRVWQQIKAAGWQILDLLRESFTKR
jgi:predicted GTPase